MAITGRSTRWGILHSLWIGWTFTLGFFNWIAFFYIGIRTKRLRWILWGLAYSVPFMFLMAIAETPAIDGWMGDVSTLLILTSGAGSIVHAFLVRKEYLLRLDARQRSAHAAEEAMRHRIGAEYGMSSQASVEESNRPHEKFIVPSTASRTESGREGEHQSLEKTFEDAGGSRVDINLASEGEISGLPGVGPILAKRTVALRREQGGFGSVEEFGEALGLRPHVVQRLRGRVAFSPGRQDESPSGRVVDF